LSDGGTKQRAPSRQPRTRRKGAPRGGRHGLSRPAAAVQTGVESDFLEVAPPRSAVRSRRAAMERLAPTPVLSREAEMAYVRADMRKLLVISAVLLALMLVILVLIGQ
jgi:hypothetical protein